jgi:hypothetical protein
MALAEPGAAERNIDEIAASEAELHRLEPQADEELIHGLVRAASDELMPAKVHNYVPLLIMRQVRDTLCGRMAAA